MTQRRLISPQVTETDAFLDMAPSAQALYFHMNLYADDDGFVDNPKSVQRMVGATSDDLKRLVEKKFLLLFDDGVIVITHWRVQNSIRKDRYKQTIHADDLSKLTLDKNGIYHLKTEQQFLDLNSSKPRQINSGQSGNQPATSGQPTVPNGCPKSSKDKLSKDKLSDHDLIDLKFNDLNNARTHAQENPSQSDEQVLKTLTATYPEQMVASAIKIAQQYGAKHPLQYAKSILEKSNAAKPPKLNGPIIPVFNLQGVQR